jgi:hypothetical protein
MDLIQVVAAKTTKAAIMTTHRFIFDAPICSSGLNALNKNHHISMRHTFLLPLAVLYRELSWRRATSTDVASFGIWPRVVATSRNLVPTMDRGGGPALQYAALVLVGKMWPINSYTKLAIL